MFQKRVPGTRQWLTVTDEERIGEIAVELLRNPRTKMYRFHRNTNVDQDSLEELEAQAQRIRDWLNPPEMGGDYPINRACGLEDEAGYRLEGVLARIEELKTTRVCMSCGADVPVIDGYPETSEVWCGDCYANALA